MNIIVGGLIEKDGKYLLVQEAKEKCHKKWNLPAGRLDYNETLIDGAKREIKEETGCDVKLTGICQIGNRKNKDDLFISVIFKSKLLNDEIEYNENEILDVQWFSYQEIISMRNGLRTPDLIINAIDNSINNIIAPLKLIQFIK